MALSESQAPAGDREPHASLTVHALNVLTSLPATGLAMRFLWLEDPNASWMELMKSATNTDGRLDKSSLALQQLKAGTYKLHFETGPYWHQLGYYCFYPYMEVLLPDWVVFTITEAEPKVHIPLLLRPYSYTTYRGS
ncbi:5-hydroxyisourate hydrolase-like isoform X4 [Sceloporus undulatus]|uniref:5-hydroxyisourate hydrolase-like isoform X4 n=1 Tax=Sceloporus undulatus TaxID=8520 RepID=UPI001C4B3D9E|nr:5-hydroxyisourate hydrolase-like isoform X4 [Sceloporus undulatus]